jgi:hypothetical protein
VAGPRLRAPDLLGSPQPQDERVRGAVALRGPRHAPPSPRRPRRALGPPRGRVSTRPSFVLAAAARPGSDETHPDGVTASCPHCGGLMPEPKPTGRPATYCKERCRKATERERRAEERRLAEALAAETLRLHQLAARQAAAGELVRRIAADPSRAIDVLDHGSGWPTWQLEHVARSWGRLRPARPGPAATRHGGTPAPGAPTALGALASTSAAWWSSIAARCSVGSTRPACPTHWPLGQRSPPPPVDRVSSPRVRRRRRVTKPPIVHPVAEVGGVCTGASPDRRVSPFSSSALPHNRLSRGGFSATGFRLSPRFETLSGRFIWVAHFKPATKRIKE